MATKTTTDSPAISSMGAVLRDVRKARKLSLADVAAATGISASFLSLLEKDKSDITIGRLVRLIDFYGISITDLLPLAAKSEYPDVVTPPERRAIQSRAEGVDFYLLTPDTKRQMMPLEVVFAPGARLAEPGAHAGEEWVLVLEGELRLELDGAEPRILRQGDAAYYPAERGHMLANASETKPLRIVTVDTPPTM